MKNDNDEEKIDPDLEKPVSKGIKSSIETEEYDTEPVINSNSELEEEIALKEHIDIDYTFNGDDVREGLSIYQRATLFKRNIIYSAILMAVFFVYMTNIIKNPAETFAIFLAVMCVAVLGFIWVLPKMHIKKIAAVADKEDMHFTMAVYDNCIKVGEENGSFIISFNKEITFIYETKNLFLVCAGKERVFILPKHCLDSIKEENLRELFKTAMKDKYIQK